MEKIVLDRYSEKVRSEVFFHTSRWLGLKTRGLPEKFRDCVLEYPGRKGKCLRAVFLRLFSDGLGGEARTASRLAAACETLQNWGLGRDDIMDQSLLRRGLPSLHRMYGQEIAVNSLDFLQNSVYEMLYSYCGFSGKMYGEVLLEFYRSVRKSMIGQHLELESRGKPLSRFTEREYFSIAALKTASYTTVGTARLGAVLAGRRDLFGAIDRFGLPLGKAFQLMDDVLDAEHDGSGAFGKSIGNDISEGKRTLVALTAFKAARPADRRRLESVYSRRAGRKPAGELLWARDLFLSSGAAASCRKKAFRLSSRALSAFRGGIYGVMKKPYGDLMLEFITKLTDRAA